jgi:hypothetical protein
MRTVFRRPANRQMGSGAEGDVSSTLRARSSAGERSPHTGEVAGSIPAAPIRQAGAIAFIPRTGPFAWDGLLVQQKEAEPGAGP